MSKPTTANYKLIKPTGDDFYDVQDNNTNMDIIDTELKKSSNGLITQAEQISNLLTIKADKNNGFNGSFINYPVVFTDFNSAIIAGQYELVQDFSLLLNKPPSVTGVCRYRFKVEDFGDMYRQEIEFQAGGCIQQTWMRNKIDGNWQPWIQVATTNKIDILFTPISGVTLEHSRSYIMNGVAFIEAVFKKTDGSNFAQNTGYFSISKVGSLLSNGSGQQVPLSISCTTSGGVPVNTGAEVSINGDSIYIVNLSQTQAHRIAVSGVVVL